VAASRALRPAYLEDLGLIPALEALSQDVGSSLGIPIVFQVVGRPRRLYHDAELAIYRIVQEELANIARHAAARHAWMILRYSKDCLRVVVKDDGAGFTPPSEPAELSRSGHFGLIGMRERAQYIDARVEVHSAPGKGARVTIFIPLPKQQSNSRQ
jgi:signal transduction histidine kinase